MAEDQVEHREDPNRSHESLYLLDDIHIEAALRAAQATPGIRIEVLPKETLEDREVAAQAYALGSEIAIAADPTRKKDLIDPELLREDAIRDMEWKTMIRVTTDRLPGEQEPIAHRFWNAFTQEIQKPSEDD